MKLKYLLIAFCLFVFGAGMAHAQTDDTFTASEVNFQQVSQYTIYPSQFDQLIMDFQFFQTKFIGKTLNAFAIHNDFNATDDEILKVSLFVDEGPSGFQGWKLDKNIAQATYRVEMNTWYFDNINYVIPEGGARFFVAVETDSVFDSNRSGRFNIVAYNDVNKDGKFQPGDWGVYFSEGLHGPTDATLQNNNAILFTQRSTDSLAPVSRITDPVYGGAIETTNYLIKGVARDQGGSSPKDVEISIQKKDDTAPLVWMPVTIIGDNYSTWEYQWSNIEFGDYVLRTRATDFTNIQETNIISYDVRVSADVVSRDLSSITADKLEAKSDGTDFIDVEVHAKNSAEKPLASKTVELKLSRDGGNIVDVVNSVTDNAGIARFRVGSLIEGDMTISATIDGVALAEAVVVNFVAAPAQPEPDAGLSGLVKAAGSPTVYLVEGSILRPFTSERIFRANGYSFDDIQVVDISGYVIGDPVLYPDGYLVSGTDGKVYVIDQGKKRWIGHPSIFEGLSYSYDNIVSIPQSFIDQYEDGATITQTSFHVNGTVFKYPGSSSVYMIENGKKRVFINANAFLSRGYTWNMIIEISPDESYPDGEALN